MHFAKARSPSVVPMAMLFAVVAVPAISALIAQAGTAWGEAAMDDILMRPEALTWKDNPNVPWGGQVAILVGDPKKQGEVVIQRLRSIRPTQEFVEAPKAARTRRSSMPTASRAPTWTCS